jgi:hypothetical protein
MFSNKIIKLVKYPNVFIYILILCVFMIICVIPYKYFKNNKNSLKYYKCLDLENNNTTDNVLKINNYKHIEKINEPWDLYIPCGYTNVETELLDIKPLNISKKHHSKAIFAVSGCDKLASKDRLWSIIEKGYGRNIAKSLMPETYITADANDMNLFKLSYDPDKIYILKKNIQDKKGLLILTDMQDIINSSYIQDFKVIQCYIKNILTLNDRKMNLRLYVAILCTPDIKHNQDKFAYLYNEGKCIYANQNYSPDDINNIESHITSVNLDKSIYKQNPESLEQLKTVLGDAKYMIIWKKLLTKLKMVIKSVQPFLCNSDELLAYNKFQLFGVDVIIDKDLDPFILEFNKGPDMSYKSELDKHLKENVMSDLFCLANVGKCATPSSTSNWITL